ncbi:MAG: MoaD/ThiS family protein [Limnochordia bacterium]
MEFLGLTRRAAGLAHLELEGATVADVLQRLLASYPDLRPHLLDGDCLRPDICILVNGRNIKYLEGEATLLDDADTITIFRQVAGGAP